MAVNAPPAPPPETIAAPSVNDPQAVADKIKAKFPDAVESVAPPGIVVKADRLVDVARHLHDTRDLAFDYLNSVTSVDFPDRIEVVYHLSSISRGGGPV